MNYCSLIGFTELVLPALDQVPGSQTESYKIIWFITWVDNVNWPPQKDSNADLSSLLSVTVALCSICSEEGLTLEMSFQIS